MKRSKTTKLFTIILSLILLINLAACGNQANNGGSAESADNSEEQTATAPSEEGAADEAATEETDPDAAEAAIGDHETFKIGVMLLKIDDESATISKYFQDYIGPRYNCEFVFSEAVTTDEAAITVIENFADAGCDAVMAYYSSSSPENTCLLAQEYGMVYNINGNRNPQTEALYAMNPDNFAGTYGANQPEVGKLFSEWMNSSLTLTDEDGFLVCTGSASTGNVQHIEISTNIMDFIQNAYGLTFDKPVSELLTSSSPILAPNDQGIEIYIYPGSTQDGYLQGLSAALQTGNYNYLLSSVPMVYTQAAVVVDEVEASFEKDITVASFGILGDALKTSFETQDRFGNSSINMATIKSPTLVASIAFIEIYNVLTGYRNVMEDENGEMSGLQFKMWSVSSLEEYNTVAGWDKDETNYIVDYDVIDSMLGVCNPDLTGEKIQDVLDSVTFDYVSQRLNQ